MNWYIGQDIVAIRDHQQGNFKDGEVYCIKSLRESMCKCKTIWIDIGKTPTFETSCCMACDTTGIENKGVCWYAERYFAPLDTLVNISELTEVLNEPAFK